RHELWERVELRFKLPPIVTGAPVADELLKLLELHALGLICDGLSIRPSRRADATSKIGKLCVGYVSAERPNGVVGICAGLSRRQDACCAYGGNSRRECSQEIAAILINVLKTFGRRHRLPRISKEISHEKFDNSG